MNTLLMKWWLILLQGILLIVLSFYVFNHPGATLVGLAFWISIMIIITGIAGTVNWFLIDKTERSTGDLLWGVGTLLLGLLLFARIGIAMTLITTLLGIWMIVTGIWLVRHGSKMASEALSKWMMIITGVLSVIAGIMVIFNLGAGAVALSTIIGLQLLLAGIALIVLALVKRKYSTAVKSKLQDLKAQL